MKKLIRTDKLNSLRKSYINVSNIHNGSLNSLIKYASVKNFSDSVINNNKNDNTVKDSISLKEFLNNKSNESLVEKYNKDIQSESFEQFLLSIDKIREDIITTNNISTNYNENISSTELQVPEGIKNKVDLNYGKFTMPLGFGWCYPYIKYTAMFLLSVKTTLSIPWMPFFVLSAVAVRMLMLPLIIKQMISIQKMTKVTPNMRLLLQLTKHSKLGNFKKVYYFLRACFVYCKQVHVNPFMFIAYNLFQMPIFFTMILAIRKLSYEQDMSNSGMLWFKNLNESDPYMILPIIAVIITYYNLGVSIIINIVSLFSYSSLSIDLRREE